MKYKVFGKLEFAIYEDMTIIVYYNGCYFAALDNDFGDEIVIRYAYGSMKRLVPLVFSILLTVKLEKSFDGILTAKSQKELCKYYGTMPYRWAIISAKKEGFHLR